MTEDAPQSCVILPGLADRAQPCRPSLTTGSRDLAAPLAANRRRSLEFGKQILAQSLMPKTLRRLLEWRAKRGWLQVAASNVLFAANHGPPDHAAIRVNIRRPREIRIGHVAARSAFGCVADRRSTPREVGPTRVATEALEAQVVESRSYATSHHPGSNG